MAPAEGRCGAETAKQFRSRGMGWSVPYLKLASSLPRPVTPVTPCHTLSYPVTPCRPVTPCHPVKKSVEKAKLFVVSRQREAALNGVGFLRNWLPRLRAISDKPTNIMFWRTKGEPVL
eukprot:gene18218-biopygen5293